MDDFLTKPIRPADLLAAIDRVLRTHSSRQSRRLDLLDAPVLLAACGGDPTLLRKMCQTLTARVPEHLAALRDALRDQDAPRLREAAHKCCGMLSEFSAAAGDLAGSLEDLAAGHSLIKPPHPGTARNDSTGTRQADRRDHRRGLAPSSRRYGRTLWDSQSLIFRFCLTEAPGANLPVLPHRSPGSDLFGRYRGRTGDGGHSGGAFAVLSSAYGVVPMAGA